MEGIAAAVSVKLPALWKEDVETWFAATESQFALRGITEELTRFHHVAAILDSSVSTAVKLLVRNPPKKEPYKALKAALREKYCLSEYQRAEAVFAIRGLGDRRPSEMLDYMLQLMGDERPGMLFKYQFLQLLPDYVRNVVSSSYEDEIQELAEEADRVFIAGRPRDFSVAHVGGDTEYDAQVDRVQQGSTRTSRSSFRQQHQNPVSKTTLCFFHARFGEKAHRCRSPCSWKGAGSGNAERGQR